MYKSSTTAKSILNAHIKPPVKFVEITFHTSKNKIVPLGRKHNLELTHSGMIVDYDDQNCITMATSNPTLSIGVEGKLIENIPIGGAIRYLNQPIYMRNDILNEYYSIKNSFAESEVQGIWKHYKPEQICYEFFSGFKESLNQSHYIVFEKKLFGISGQYNSHKAIFHASNIGGETIAPQEEPFFRLNPNIEKLKNEIMVREGSVISIIEFIAIKDENVGQDRAGELINLLKNETNI